MTDHPVHGDETRPGPTARPWLAMLVMAARILAVLVLLNAAMNLVGSLPAGATPGVLGDGVVHGDWRTALTSLCRPGAAAAVWRTWSPVARVLSMGCLLLGTGVAMALRPAAAAGLFLAAGLLLLTLRSTGSNLWADLAAAHAGLLLLSVVLYGVVIMITVVRWRLLLAVQGIRVPLWSLSRLTLIGVFFNLAIPGAVSGDLVKMGYLTRWSGARRAEGVLTILVDRIIGMLGLFVVASVSVLAALPMLLRLGPECRPLQMAAVTVGLGSLAGVIGVGLVECRAALVRHPWIAALVAWGARVLPPALTALIGRLVSALELFRGNRLAMARAMLMAIAVHGLLAVNLWALGRALGEHALRPSHYVITASVANAVAAIPVTPGGLGTRDKTTAIFLSAFQAAPPEKAGSIPVALSLVIALWALVGALALVTAPRGARAAAGAATAADETATPAA